MGKTDTEELKLLSRAAAGDNESYRKLFKRHSEKLFNFIYYMTFSREESEDINRNAFVKVYEGLQGREVGNLNFRAYLYRAARNLSLNAIARRKREGLTLEEALDFQDPDLFSDPEKAALLSEQRSKVLQASRDLTDEQHVALLLRETAGFHYDAISEILDTNPNAVGALLSRARLKFREVFRMAYAQTDGVPEDCTRITPLLSKYIDGEATPRETHMVESHLEDCPICRGNMESMREASTTYRSLIPVLPLASFKVWTGTQAGILGAEATGAAVGAGAAAGTAAGTTAAGGAAVATTVATTAGMGIAAKIVAMVAAVLVATGAGIGGYYVATNTIFARKEVPVVEGLKEAEARQEVEDAALEFAPDYTYDYRTGNEVVVAQSPGDGTEVDKGTMVTGTLEDREFELARQQASGAVGQANQSLAEVQVMGIDTSDLAGPVQKARFRLDNARTVDKLVGPEDSAAYWANVVKNECEARKQAYLAEQERKREAEEREKEIAASKQLVSQWQTAGANHLSIQITDVRGTGTIMVSMTVNNIDAMQPVGPSFGYLVDESGIAHGPEMGYFLDDSLWAVSIPVGATKQGTLVFEVPPEQKRFTFVMQYHYDWEFNLKAKTTFVLR